MLRTLCDCFSAIASRLSWALHAALISSSCAAAGAESTSLQAVQLVNTLNLMRRRAPSDWAAVAPSTLSFPEARRAQAPVYQPAHVGRGSSQVSLL